MAGAWEMQRSVLAGVLHTDLTSIAWAFGLRRLKVPGPVIGLAGMPYDMARNQLCQASLDGGFDYVFHYDSDVIPPPDAVLRLVAHNLPVVSGVYCRRSPPHAIPVMLKDGKWISDPPRDKIIDVDLVGAGCLLIRRDVLQRLPPLDPQLGRHWFSWRVDRGHMLPPGEGLSEDFSFCLHCRKHGIPVKVDTSIMCQHVGLAKAGLHTFDPCEVQAA